MKYVCKICGFVYDDAKEKVPFENLPQDWVCPVCGASKSDFKLVVEEKSKKSNKSKNKKPETKFVEKSEDLQKLSVAELSALCSNLARGCEKQYKFEEMEMFKTLAEYFSKIASPVQNANVETLSSLLTEDIDENYPNLAKVATDEGDRGTLRVCTWGEKVSRMLASLLSRYQKEGEEMLENTDIWVCTICGFVYIGEKPPEICPVCKVQSFKFEKIERRASV